jgi:hypothetical protein
MDKKFGIQLILRGCGLVEKWRPQAARDGETSMVKSLDKEQIGKDSPRLAVEWCCWRTPNLFLASSVGGWVKRLFP